MKVGILGTGFGAYHTELYSGILNNDEIILWGRNKEKLNELKNIHNVKITEDMNDIFNDEEIQLVDICLPNELHKKYAIKAMECGKNVFCEVPVTLSYKDAKELEEYSKKCNCMMMVDLFERFDFAYSYLKEAIDNGKYGTLRSFRIWRQTPPWWGSLGKNDIVFKLMIHDIDYISYILGEPNNIEVSNSFPDEGKGVVNVNLKYDNTIVMLQSSSMMASRYPFSVGYEAIFDNGVIKYNSDGYSDRQDIKLKVITNEDESKIRIPNKSCYRASVEEVIRDIKEHKESINDIKQAKLSIKLAEEIQKKM